jgi:hypothetical protein
MNINKQCLAGAASFTLRVIGMNHRTDLIFRRSSAFIGG